jgi:hypothetical protein
MDLKKHEQPSLMSLPAEVRVMIWNEVLVQAEPITVVDQVDKYHEAFRLLSRAIHSDVALLRVCKTIYEEAIEDFYGENIFIISIDLVQPPLTPDGPQTISMRSPLQLVRQYIHRIRRLSIELDWVSKACR